MSQFDKGHALIIGVGEYLNPAWNVSQTVTEAEAVYAALCAKDVAAYHPQRVSLLTKNTPNKPTLASITTALRNLAQQVQPDSTVFIYLAGHGTLDTSGEYCFAAQDTIFTTDNRIQAGTGLRQTDLLALLKQLRPQKLLILINACFSGNVQAGAGALGNASPDGVLGMAPSDQTIELLVGGEGRALITASRSNQQSSYYTAQPHTFFGQAVIDGLRGHGLAGVGGYIGLFEFYTFVHTRVTQAAAGLGRLQEPVITLAQGVGGFPIALHQGGSGALDASRLQTQLPIVPELGLMARVALTKFIREKFNDNELRDLCFEMGVNYEDLGGEGRAGKARELVAYCERRARLPELERTAQRLSAELGHGSAAPSSTGSVFNQSGQNVAGNYVDNSVTNDNANRARPGSTSPRRDDQTQERASLQRQLAAARENLRLIEERESEYVERASIPLQLIKDERYWRNRIKDLEAQVGG